MKARSLIVFLLLLGLAGCQSGPPQFQFGAYSEAERFYEKEEYAKAITKYQEYLRENRQGNMAVIAQYYMAKSHEALGQTDEARSLYEKIMKEHPALIWAEFSKSRLKEIDSRAAAH